MRYICFIAILFAMNIFSCGTSNSKEKIKPEDTPVITTDDNIDADGHTTIIGRIHTYGGSRDSVVGIEDENGTVYAVYPREIGEELKSYRGRLIKFTVIILDKPQGQGGLMIGKNVTPISWEIIEGPPVIPPKITSLGVVRVTGVVKVIFPMPRDYYVVKGIERWKITSGEIDRISDQEGYTVTVEGEGTVTEPGSLPLSPFGVNPDTLSEEEYGYLIDPFRKRELSNVKVILVHNPRDRA